MSLFGSSYHEDHVHERRRRAEDAACAPGYRKTLKRIAAGDADPQTLAITALRDSGAVFAAGLVTPLGDERSLCLAECDDISQDEKSPIREESA